MRTRTRGSFGQALKDAAIRFAREAERYVGATDETPCANATCAHPRSKHCGCGTVCLGDTGGTARCECIGFAEGDEP